MNGLAQLQFEDNIKKKTGKKYERDGREISGKLSKGHSTSSGLILEKYPT